MVVDMCWCIAGIDSLMLEKHLGVPNGKMMLYDLYGMRRIQNGQDVEK
jgi:hypothetical protein